jgi:heme/copper-type cytochrome/quinol oxidase subunit 3
MRWPRLSSPIHLSPYPMQIGMRTLAIVSSIVILLKRGVRNLLFFGLIRIILCIYLWWRELLEEIERGEGSLQLLDSLKLGFSLFIFREIILLVTFFWTFLHFALSPSIWRGLMWPPVGIVPIDPKGVPLLNTLLLIRRGVTVTWGHHLLILGDKPRRRWAFAYTVLLGGGFIINQILEFKEAPFSIRDRIYGRIFLVLTGLHGMHVLLGLVILLDVIVRVISTTCTSLRHVKVELLIWYWHLVDCVWLIVYSFIYWWGG